MLVRSATAPGAVLRTLPALDAELWGAQPGRVGGSHRAGRGLRARRPGRAPAYRAPPAGPQPTEDTFARAVDHGDEHVIKFADAAADVYTRTGNPDALAAALRAADLIER